jgi:hypothetical protein
MKRTIRESVADSFADNDKATPEKLGKYLEWLREAYVEAIHYVRRLILGTLALMAAFEILRSSNLVEISIGGLKITRSSLILAFIPSLVSYLLFQISLSTARVYYIRDYFEATFELWSKSAHQNRLDKPILPQGEIFWVASMQYIGVSPEEGKATHAISSLLTGGIILLLLAFEGHAFYALFAEQSHSIPLIAISLVLTIGFLILAVTTLGEYARGRF